MLFVKLIKLSMDGLNLFFDKTGGAKAPIGILLKKETKCWYKQGN